MSIRRYVFGFVLLAALGAGCRNHHPVAPGFAPAPDAPTIVCPADVTLNGVTGLSRVVTYSTPVPTGGYAPVTSSCSPASGSTFPLGTTLVTCNASDSLQQQRTCAFNVTLTPLVLNVTKIVAFGDSLTEGENGNGVPGACPASARTQCVDVANTYPMALSRLIKADFPQQDIPVINAGVSGNRARDDVSRLGDVLAANRPDTLLLLHGFNDLLALGTSGVSDVIGALKQMILLARQRAVKNIFVATLMKSGTGNRTIDPRAIDQVNAGLRTLVPAEGATLVDIVPLFAGREGELMEPDGLHLTAAGYQVLAQAFFDAMKASLTTTSSRPLQRP